MFSPISPEAYRAGWKALSADSLESDVCCGATVRVLVLPGIKGDITLKAYFVTVKRNSDRGFLEYGLMDLCSNAALA